MTESQKIRRLRALGRKIGRSKTKGYQKRAAELDYDRTARALGRLTWVSSPPVSGGINAEALSVNVQGTFKRKKRG